MQPPTHIAMPFESGLFFGPQIEPPIVPHPAMVAPAIERQYMIPPPMFHHHPSGPGFMVPGPHPYEQHQGPFPRHPHVFHAPQQSFHPIPHSPAGPLKFDPHFHPMSAVFMPDGMFAMAQPPHPHSSVAPSFSPPLPHRAFPVYPNQQMSPVAGPSMPSPPRPAHHQTYHSSPVSSTHSISSSHSGSDRSSEGRPKSKDKTPRKKIMPRTSVGPSTEILHAFRNTQDRKWTLPELKGHFSEFSKDQYGSRFVQDAITEASCADIDMIFDEIVEADILKISKDVFGNYVVQRILEHGTDSHKNDALHRLQGHMREMSLHVYGCRVVQKLLDVVTSAEQCEIVQELEPHIPECVESAHGNHVIQKILEVVPPTYLNFVDVFRGRVVEFARHTYGCRVIQRCFQHLPMPQAQPLLTEFMDQAYAMITDQFGNYVIQYLLEHGRAHERDYIVSLMRGKIVYLSLHKHASNVCEKALQHSSETVRQELIDEILALDPALFPVGVFALVHDQYGNYVLQRAVELARGPQKDYLMSLVSQQLRQAKVSFKGDEFVKYLAVDRALKKHGLDARKCAPRSSNAGPPQPHRPQAIMC